MISRRRVSERALKLSAMALFVLVTWSGLAPLASAQTAVDLFRADVLHELRIRMTPADWRTIHEKYLEDTYYPCDAQFDGVTVTQVGMRSRGSQSRSPIKPSIGLDFSRYISSQRFAGLKTLVVRNLNQDASMMHEILAEELFARVGLPHSRESFARLWVNDEYAGVYLLVEPLDARFVKVALGDDTGYLYELQDTEKPYRFEYVGSDPASYVPALFDPKTHSSAPDGAGWAETIRRINQATDANFVADVGTVVDLNDVVAHAAAEAAVGNWDGLRGINGMRNLYLYRWQPARRLLLLAWDMDGAFVDARWPVMPDPAEPNVLVRRALAVPALRQLYFEMLDQAGHAMADQQWLAREIERLYQLIRQPVYDDQYKLCRIGDGIGPCSNVLFEAAVDFLRDFANVRPDFLKQSVANEYTPAAGAPVIRPGDLKGLGQTADNFAVAPWSLAAVKTTLGLARDFYAASVPLPTALGGVNVQTAAGDAELVQVRRDGILLAVPPTLAAGPQVFRVIDNGRSSNALMVEVRPTASVILGATHATGAPISNQFPVVGGELVVLYASGAWAGNIATAPAELSVTVNGAVAKIVWAGWAPGFVGLSQFVIQAPASFGASLTASATVLLDGEPGLPYAFPVRGN